MRRGVTAIAGNVRKYFNFSELIVLMVYHNIQSFLLELIKKLATVERDGSYLKIWGTGVRKK